MFILKFTFPDRIDIFLFSYKNVTVRSYNITWLLYEYWYQLPSGYWHSMCFAW